jgi:hypothetical protein
MQAELDIEVPLGVRILDVQDRQQLRNEIRHDDHYRSIIGQGDLGRP